MLIDNSMICDSIGDLGYSSLHVGHGLDWCEEIPNDDFARHNSFYEVK